MTSMDLMRLEYAARPAMVPSIPIGRRYRTVGARWTAWIVRQVVNFPTESLPHVRLQRVDHPREYKSVSLDALLDPRLYHPVDGGPVDGGPVDGMMMRTAARSRRLGGLLSRLISGRS